MTPQTETQPSVLAFPQKEQASDFAELAIQRQQQVFVKAEPPSHLWEQAADLSEHPSQQKEQDLDKAERRSQRWEQATDLSERPSFSVYWSIQLRSIQKILFSRA